MPRIFDDYLKGKKNVRLNPKTTNQLIVNLFLSFAFGIFVIDEEN